MYRPLALVAALGLLGGCASIPKPLQGTYAVVPLASAQQGGQGGQQVRWGGEIIQTEPGPDQTCFYLLSRPLDQQARPRAGDAGDTGDSQGRFVACHAGFYDPEVFVRGREMTVTGTLHGIVTKKVGDFDYAYPRVEANVIYLWPKRVPMANYYPYPSAFYDPFWGPRFGPGYYGYGGWGNPYWGRPPVIIVRPHPAPRPRG